MAREFFDFSTFSTGLVSSVGGTDLEVIINADSRWQLSVLEESGATGGKVLAITDTAGVGALSNAIGFTNYETTGDIEIVARVKVAALGTTSVGPVLMGSTTQGYGIELSVSAGNLNGRSSRWTGGGTNAAGTPSITATSPGDATYFWIRIQRRDESGSKKIKSRWWSGAAGDEGSTWSVMTDSTYSSVQAALYVGNYVIAPVTADVVGIATGTDITDVGLGAPTSADASTPIPLFMAHYS